MEMCLFGSIFRTETQFLVVCKAGTFNQDQPKSTKQHISIIKPSTPSMAAHFYTRKKAADNTCVLCLCHSKKKTIQIPEEKLAVWGALAGFVFQSGDFVCQSHIKHQFQLSEEAPCPPNPPITRSASRRKETIKRTKSKPKHKQIESFIIFVELTLTNRKKICKHQIY